MADPTLEALLARVEANVATAYQIDLAVARWLCSAGAIVNCEPDAYLDRFGGWAESVDAMQVLIERRLIGWDWRVDYGPLMHAPAPYFAQIAEPIETPYGPGVGIRGQHFAHKPSRALLGCWLRAEIARISRSDRPGQEATP